MCKAWSGIVLESGKVLWEMGLDSHDGILRKFGIPDKDSKPSFARVEISPDNGNYLKPDKWTFRIDEQIAPEWWKPIYEKYVHEAHKEWLKKLNRILVKKPIVHPFRDIKTPKKITKKHLALLKQWASVGDSVWASVWDSVGASVWDSVWDSVGASVRANALDSVGDSVWASVWASVRDSVWASVRDSVRASVWASVWASAGAYIGSFFRLPRKAWKYTENIKCKDYPFQPAVDLWMIGLVPSYDGKVWRLHGGKDGKVLWEGKIER